MEKSIVLQIMPPDCRGPYKNAILTCLKPGRMRCYKLPTFSLLPTLWLERWAWWSGWRMGREKASGQTWPGWTVSTCELRWPVSITWQRNQMVPIAWFHFVLVSILTWFYYFLSKLLVGAICKGPFVNNM